MSYTRKTRDYWSIEGNYPGSGWEEVTAETTRAAAKTNFQLYRQSEPGISFRLRRRREKLTSATLEGITPEMFEKNEETGKLRIGIQWVYGNEGLAECYQYDTVDEVVACARAYQTQPPMRHIKIVTHTGQYQNMRTIFEWKAKGGNDGAAGNGRIPALA